MQISDYFVFALNPPVPEYRWELQLFFLMLNKISKSLADREKVENTVHTHPEDTNIMRQKQFNSVIL